MIRRFFAVVLMFSLLAARPSAAAEMPEMKLNDFNDVVSHHPAGDALRRLFPGKDAAPPPAHAHFQPTGLTKKDYLKLIAGNVDYWKQHQDKDGAILDPYEKNKETGANLEKQYSTPAFASAAALLVKEAGRDDLLEPATRAFEFALAALLNKTTANQHPDFYIPMLVHAWRILHERVPQERAAKWESMMKAIDPQVVYKDRTAGANWNVVNVAGEALRRKSGLVADEQKDAQQQYLDEMLKRQQRRFTPLGLYEDPHTPLPYDVFPRLWLEEVVADDAYQGPQREQLERFLALGGLSSLLLLSPQGEWPSGGRSAHHQWNEAAAAVVFETNANKWKKAGRDDLASSFKRAAHLALKSMQRWQRPSGELWIVKNRAEPDTRHGFEGYSFHSQYNLLPMGMLAIAYDRADESIEEKPIPSEVGGYVFDVREKFHKVVAAAGGYYVLVDTMADENYDGTGLQRVHRAGVELSPLSASSGSGRVFGPHPRKDVWALTPGIQWKTSADAGWRGLAQFHLFHAPKKGEEANPADLVVKAAALTVTEEKPERVAFSVKYDLTGNGARPVEESFVLTPDGVEGTSAVQGEKPAVTRALFPAFVHDGAKEHPVEVAGNQVTTRRDGATLTWEVVDPPGVKLERYGPEVATHNGYVRPIVGELPNAAPQLKWKLTLQPGAPASAGR